MDTWINEYMDTQIDTQILSQLGDRQAGRQVYRQTGSKIELDGVVYRQTETDLQREIVIKGK